MEHPLLNDPKIFPTDSVLAQHLGKSFSAWLSFLELLKLDFPGAAFEWRYYNDGKSWLGKVAQKKKTLCWVAVWDRFFSCTFYLNAKAEPLVEASALDQATKDAFLSSAGKTKFRHIRAEIRKKSDLPSITELLKIKTRTVQGGS